MTMLRQLLLLALVGLGLHAQAPTRDYGKVPGYALDLRSFMGCPISGDATDRRRMESNLLKNRYLRPPAAAVDPTATLEDLLGAGMNDARSWSSESGVVIEGFVVAVRTAEPNDANCHRSDEPGRDTIIEMAPFRNAPPLDRLYAVVTPRAKLLAAQGGDRYDTQSLQRLVGTRIQVTGWLFFDAAGAWSAKNTNETRDDARRATAWEVHPVLDIVPLGLQ